MTRRYNVIVLSGLPGSGKSVLLKKLNEKIGWPIHSIGDLFRKRLKNLQEIGELNQELTIEEWWPTLSDDEQREVNTNLLNLVNKGEVIADTRYAFYLKQATSNPLFIFLMADLDLRARREIANPDYYGKTIEEVINILKRREEEEARIGLDLFGRDYRILSDYDLILDSGKLSIGDEVSIIMSHLSK